MRLALRLTIAGTLAVASLTGTAVASVQTFTVHRGARTRPRPLNFLSLSLTYRTVERWTGAAGSPVDPVLLQLVRNLDPGGRPVLRVGGQGADRTWWPAKGLHRPLGVSDTLSPRFIATARRLADALPARYLLQVNLEAGSTRVARVEADHLVAGLGRRRIAALEIGNEPDLYTAMPWYWELGGRPLPWYADRGTPVYARGAGYGAIQFLGELRRTLRVLPDGVQVAGPDLEGTQWLGAYAALMSRRSRFRYLDLHAYPLTKCVSDPVSPRYPSITHLLAPGAARGLLSGVAGFIGAARRAHAKFVVDELGSDSCGGVAGVDDAFASALWVTDALFSLDRAGVDGVDLHTIPGLANGLFGLRHLHGRWRARIHPLYDGALLFADAAPAGSRLLTVSGGDPDGLHAWAARAPDHALRVVFVNPGPATVATLRLPPDDRAQAAEVQRLRPVGGGLAGHSGTTFTGRRFATTSTGIVPRGRAGIARPHGGRYRIDLPAHSEALVTAPPRRRG